MTRKKNVILFVFVGLAVLAGMGLVAYATALGPGVGGDATIYLTSARNFLAGKGLGWTDADGSFRLLPYSPPFYPLVLSGVGLVTRDLVAGARWLNVVLFGLTLAIFGWSFYRATLRPWLAAILTGVLATSPVILGVQVWAMTESLFLLLGFAGLLALLAYFERPRRWVLATSALLCGLAFLTRYIGVAYVATGCLALMMLGHREDGRVRLRLNWQNLRSAIVYGLIAILPMLIWLVIDFSLTGTVGSRSAQPASAYWHRFLEMGPALQQIYLFWLLPDSRIPGLPGIFKTFLWLIPLVLVILLTAALYRRASSVRVAQPADAPVSASSWRMAALFGLFTLVYLVTLVIVQVFTYPPITLASRMLSPVHLAVIVLGFVLLHLALNLLAPGSRVVTGLVYLGCLALLGVYGLRGTAIARGYHGGGIGYMMPVWQESETVAQMKKLPADVPIISNETTAVMFFAGRPAYAIQEIYQDQPQSVFTPYGAGDDPAQRAFREQGGALVLFNLTLADDFSMYGERTGERIKALTQGLYPLYQGEDGAIYLYQSPTSSAPPLDEYCD